MLKCGSRYLSLEKPLVMGILNSTPDSFSDGGQLYSGNGLDLSLALKQAEVMVESGAHIIDVGGESTRPGAAKVSLQEELDRVIPVVEAVTSEFDVVVSVDSSSPEVMTESSRAGAGMINDVRALGCEGAIDAAQETGLPVCIMHMQGNPQNMQLKPAYESVTHEVREYLSHRVETLVDNGFEKQRLIVDPGFGFGKNMDHNLSLLRDLPKLTELELPIMVGLSRKSMLGTITGRGVNDRLAGSLAVAMLAAQRGASILRVHDVAETVDVLKILEADQGQVSL